MSKTQQLLISALIFLSQTTFAHSLSSSEAGIKSYVVSHKVDQIHLLEKLVNINSGTHNIQGVKEVGQILKQQLAELGFKTYWVEEPPSMHRAPTLVAEHKGSSGKRLLLIGHLDTVFPKHSSFQKFVRKGEFATGPGVLDDKGGDVVILYALKALKANHVLDNANITVVLTGDEEDSGKPATISRRPLLAAAAQSDIALDFESATSLDKAAISRRGISSWILEVEGIEGHSSLIFKPEFGDGAIFELVRILNTMRQKLAAEKYLSFNPALIAGGTQVDYEAQDSAVKVFGPNNVIAKKAVASGDLRYLDLRQKISVEAKISDIVHQHLAGTTANVYFQEGIPSMPPTTANQALLQQYSVVSNALGYGRVSAVDPALRGAGDISYVAALISAGLVGLGPTGSHEHSAEETIDLNSLAIQTERAAILIDRLTH